MNLKIFFLLLASPLACKPVETGASRRAPNLPATTKPAVEDEPEPINGEDDAKAKLSEDLWKAAMSLTWSLTGPEAGKTCINIKPPTDGIGWEQVNLCWEGPLQLELDHTGEKPDSDCIQLYDPDSGKPWSNSFLCQPKTKSTCLRFVDLAENATQPDDTLKCVNLAVAELDSTWSDNFLCTVKEKDGLCPALPEKITGGPYTDIGEMKWINDGNVPAGWYCLNLIEASDPKWSSSKNFLCFKDTVPVQWSKAGQIAGKTCLAINDSAAPDVWKDNFLCYDNEKYCLRYSDTNSIPDMECLNLKDSQNSIWANNYLCKPTAAAGCPLPPPSEPAPEFRLLPGLEWSSGGAAPQKTCLQWSEANELASHTWQDNFLCWNPSENAQLLWSDSGPISGRVCSKINEPKSAQFASWENNYLCAADDRYCLRWSHEGPIPDMDCLQITEKAEPADQGWDNNYLCIRRSVDSFCPK